MERSRKLVLAGGAVLVAAAAGAIVVVLGRGGEGRAIPFVPPMADGTIEFGTPPPVRARMIRQERAWIARARAARLAPRSRAAGCRIVTGESSRYLGPPAPDVKPSIIGRHVVVEYDFGRLPSSAACRPVILRTALSGRTDVTGPGRVGEYLIQGPRGRVVSELALFATAPYQLEVTTSTVDGVRSRRVVEELRCPEPTRTSAAVSAALSRRIQLLPLHGVDRSGLVASPVRRGRRASRARDRVDCPSLSSCEVTYVDPDFPSSPYRVRLRIGGEQVNGCWMSLRDGGDDPPYEMRGRNHAGRLRLLGRLSAPG